MRFLYRFSKIDLKRKRMRKKFEKNISKYIPTEIYFNYLYNELQKLIPKKYRKLI